MGSLFFPQLSTGAIAQYPIKKLFVTRSVTNVLADGSMLVQADPYASRLVWEMSFTELSPADSTAILNHFQACCGPYRAFTFIDPTDNMLACSIDFTQSSWVASPQIQISAGAPDPNGGTSAFVITNKGQAAQQLLQQLIVPANYQYCFSLYACSDQPTSLTLLRQGFSTAASESFSVTSAWNRFVSSGQLNDAGTTLSVGVLLEAGQQVTLFGPQLEPQIQPSRYRPTSGAGGVYPNAHWTANKLPMTSEAPNLFSAAFTIQTNL